MTKDERIEWLEKELAEADRRAGAAERKNAYTQETLNRRIDWLYKAKKEAGYPSTTSFDVIWKETLEKARAH